MKTKEEILDSKTNYGDTDAYSAHECIEAMEEYASQFKPEYENLKAAFDMLADAYLAPMHLTAMERKVFVDVLYKKVGVAP